MFYNLLSSSAFVSAKLKQQKGAFNFSIITFTLLSVPAVNKTKDDDKAVEHEIKKNTCKLKPIDFSYPVLVVLSGAG